MNKSGFRILVLILSFSMVAATSHAIIEEKSSIVGTLINATNQPYAGVTVRLLDSFFLDEVAKTITDSHGKFVLPDLLPGLYLVSLQLPHMPEIIKRVEVISGSPTFIDVKPLLTDDEIKKHNAWDDLKWTIRSAQRNPLRDEGADELLADSSAHPDQGLLASLQDFQQRNNINGQFSYVNMADVSTASLNQRVAQFALAGQTRDDASWSFNGNILDGVRSRYAATGDFSYRLSTDHRIGTTVSANDLVYARYPDLMDGQRITRFIHSSSSNEVSDESRMWITSVDVQDNWQAFSRIKFNYGTRIDYYGYLQNSVSYSPRFEVLYQQKPDLVWRGVYYRNLTAPGNLYQLSNGFSSYANDVAFIPYTGSIRPERTIGVEGGFDVVESQYQLSLYYHTESIDSKIATVDLGTTAPINEQLQSNSSFIIFNATNLHTQGVECQFKKHIGPNLTAIASYDVTGAVPVAIIEKHAFDQSQLFFREGQHQELYHDVYAGIQADIRHTDTQVNASWKWSSGSPLIFGRIYDNGSMAAIDLEVRQGLPVRFMPQDQFQLLVAIKNLLDQNSDVTTNADFERALIYGMPRIISGGVLVKF